MTNLPAIIQQRGISQERYEAISLIYPDQKPETIAMIDGYCKARGLDIMRKPVHPVKYGDKIQFIPSINLDRTTAHRTGNYAGQDEAEFGEEETKTFTLVKTDWQTKKETKETVSVTFPKFCKVTVYRDVNGKRCPFSAKMRWLETYVKANRKGDSPGDMWAAKPFLMLEKCAEAAALRKAFPEEFGNEYDGGELQDLELPEQEVVTGKGQDRLEEVFGRAMEAEIVTDPVIDTQAIGQKSVSEEPKQDGDPSKDANGESQSAHLLIEELTNQMLDEFRERLKGTSKHYQTEQQLKGDWEAWENEGVIAHLQKTSGDKYEKLVERYEQKKKQLNGTRG